MARYFRQRHIKEMIARGEAPRGYRINDDRDGFVRIGSPAWPELPFDPFCCVYTDPSIELAVLIREVIPEFDPEANPKAWLDVAEVVRRGGRSSEEIRVMGHDQLIAFFRYEVFHARQGASPGSGDQTAPGRAAATPAAAGCDSHVEDKRQARLPARESTAEILRRMLSNERDRARLVEAGSAAGVAKLIRKSTSAVKEAGRPWDELCELLLVHRTNRRTLREMKRGRKS